MVSTRAKEEKKPKKVRKARRAKASAKRCHEAEKAGLPEPESSETLVSEIEGGEDLHWLNELVDEEHKDEEIPPASGGQRPQGVGGPRGVSGSKGREGRPLHYR